jgi:RNA polymerase sigma-70 factor (ECF subfamily)
MDDTSRSLLERLRTQPSDEAWKRLVDLYTPLVRRWVRHFGARETDLDDLVQEVMSVVVQKMPRFEHSGQRGAFRRWLRTIAFNRAQLQFRARQKADRDPAEAVTEVPDPCSDLDQKWEREHDEYVTQRLLELLRPEFADSTWQAFLRLVMDEAAPAEVAAELDITVNAALIAKSRVLRRLRDESRGLVD